MPDDFNPPSQNPGNEGSLAGVLRQAMGKMLQGMDDMMPAKVIAYDRATNRATIQPMIMMGTTEGAKVSRAQVASVPVFQFGGGGFVLAFPLQPGDLGWLKASDRDTSLFLQSFNEDTPNTARMHTFADGLFFPDVVRAWTLNGADAERVVLQSTDGATRIAVGDGVVEITASLLKVNGNLQVTGSASIAGGVTGSGGIVLETHKHTGVQTGGGTSGGPTP